MKSHRRLLIAFVGIILAVGCVSVKGGGPEQSSRTFVFAPEIPAANRSSSTVGTLLVAPPSARAGYDTRAIIYTRSASELSWYAQSQWADIPSRMLEPLLVQAMEATGRFDAVVDITAGISVDMRLDTEIVALRQEFVSGQASEVRITVRARLVNLNDRAVLANGTFEATATAPSDDAPGGVAATNEALGEILEQVGAFGVAGASALPAE